MFRLNQLVSKYFKFDAIEKQLVKLSQLKLRDFKIKRIPKNIDFSILRISPVDNSHLLKEQFIPLARSTVIRTLSQDQKYIPKSSQSLFEEFSRYLDTCISNRNIFFLKEIKTGYEHLNPDVDVLTTGIKWSIPRRQILDDEFWFMQKLCRLTELANFKEVNRSYLEKWLRKHGGYSSVQVWVDSSKYEMLKVWFLGRENHVPKSIIDSFLKKYFPFLLIFGNPFKTGNSYRRVVVAVRLKQSDKIELKMFKELSEGELVYALPTVEILGSQFDRNMLFWTGSLTIAGLFTNWLLPETTLTSSWLLTSTHQLAISLAVLSAGVGFLNWNVMQQKIITYWKWRSELNYRSIVANNRGVINMLGDRAQDEIFKESMIAYINILAHPNGVTQEELESQVKSWILQNCSPDFKETSVDIQLDLTETLSLLRQMNIVTLDPMSYILTAKSLENATAILSSEFQVRNMPVELDGHTVIRNDSNSSLVVLAVDNLEEDSRITLEKNRKSIN